MLTSKVNDVINKNFPTVPAEEETPITEVDRLTEQFDNRAPFDPLKSLRTSGFSAHQQYGQNSAIRSSFFPIQKKSRYFNNSITQCIINLKIL